MRKLLILFLLIYLPPTKLYANSSVPKWPLWSGGSILNFQHCTHGIDPKTKQLEIKNCTKEIRPKSGGLKKIEVYQLDAHKEARDWRILFEKDQNSNYDVTIYFKKRGANTWSVFMSKKSLDITNFTKNTQLDPAIFIQKTTGGTTEIPFAIPYLINKHRLAETNNWKCSNSPTSTDCLPSKYAITFSTDAATLLKTENGKQIPAMGKISDIYPSYRTYKQGLYHAGIDITAPSGTTVGAVSAGRVLSAGATSPTQLAFEEVTVLSNGLPLIYSHIRVSDFIRTSNSYPKHIKLGEITADHPRRHLHFSIQKRTQNTAGGSGIRDNSKSGRDPIGVKKNADGTYQNNTFLLNPDPYPSKKPLIISHTIVPDDYQSKQALTHKSAVSTNKSATGVLFTVKGKVDIVGQVGDPTCIFRRVCDANTKVCTEKCLDDYSGVGEAWYRIYHKNGGSASPFQWRSLYTSSEFLAGLPTKRSSPKTIPPTTIFSFAQGSKTNDLTTPNQYWLIFTNNLSPSGNVEYFSKEGSWNTNQMKLNKKLFPDDSYEIQMKVRSAFGSRDWSKTTIQKVIVDNTPPILTNAEFLGTQLANNTLIKKRGTTPSNPACIGDLLYAKLSFDQPMLSTGPQIQVLSGTLGLWTSQPLTWKLTDTLSPPLQKATLEGAFELKEFQQQTQLELNVKVSGAQGIGAFKHSKAPNAKADEMLPTTTFGKLSSTPLKFYADLQRPVITWKRQDNKVTITYHDPLTGLTSGSWQIDGGKEKYLPIKNGSCPKTPQSITITLPKDCQGKTFSFRVSARDCAGNWSDSTQQLNQQFVSFQVKLPSIACNSSKYDSRCSRTDINQTCSPKVNACIVKSVSTIRKNVPSCDNPDENVDTSTHAPRYKDAKNIDPNAHIAILDSEHAPHALKLFATFGEKAAILPRSFAPTIHKKYPILFIPSGALGGQSTNRALKAALDGYVKQGGRLFVLSQAWGKEWSVLPGNIKAKGWNEAISCFFDSSKASTEHETLSSLTSQRLDIPLDGYFTQLPKTATILLRHTLTGHPISAVYPHDKGTIVLSTSYADWGHYWSQSTQTDRDIIRDTLTWLQDPKSITYNPPEKKLEQKLSYTYKGTQKASHIRIRVLSPNRDKILYHKQIAKTLSPNDVTQLSYSLTLPKNSDNPQHGIYHTELTIFSSKGNALVGPIELPEGRFILGERLSALRYLSGLQMRLYTKHPLYTPRQSTITLTAELQNLLPPLFPGPRQFHLYVQDPNKPLPTTLTQGKSWKQTQTLTIPTNSSTNETLTFVAFDKDAPNVQKPPFASGFVDPWPFAKSVQIPLVREEPNITLTPQTDKLRYHSGEQINLTVNISTKIPITFPGKLMIELLNEDCTSTFTQKTLNTTFDNNTKLTLKTTLSLPKRITGSLPLHISLYDLSGGKTFKLQQITHPVFVAGRTIQIKPKLTAQLSPGTPITFELKSLSSLDVDATVYAALKDIKGRVLKSDTKNITTFKGNSTQTISLQPLPNALPLGEYTLEYYVETVDGRNDGSIKLPASMSISLTPNTRAVRLGEDVQRTLTLKNTGRFQLTPSATWQLTGFTKGQITKQTLDVGEEKSFTIQYKIPYNHKGGQLQLQTEINVGGTNDTRQQTLIVVVPDPSLSIYVTGNAFAVGKDAEVSVTVDPLCCFVGSLQGTLTLSAPALSFTQSKPLTFSSATLQSHTFTVPIKSLPAGVHKLEATFTLPSGQSTKKTQYFSLPDARFTLHLQSNSVNAGTPIIATVKNEGGTAATVGWIATLFSSDGTYIIHTDGGAAFPAKHTKTFQLIPPNNTPSGTYTLTVELRENNQLRKTFKESITLTGLQTTLSVSTDKNNYQPTDSGKLLYTLTANNGEITNSTLTLTISKERRVDTKNIKSRYPTQSPTAPWPMFRGSPKRWGSSFGTALFSPQNNAQLWQTVISPTNWSTDRSPRAPVVADINNDNKPEIITVSHAGEVVALDKDGKRLWRAIVNAAGSVAVADIDGKPGLEVIIGTTSCSVQALSGSKGAVLWTTSLGTGCEAVGRPLLADIDNDGKLDIGMTARPPSQGAPSNHIVTLLDAATGKVKWSVGTSVLSWDPPMPLAVADLGGLCTTGTCNTSNSTKDGKLELVAGNGAFAATVTSGSYPGSARDIAGLLNHNGTTRFIQKAATPGDSLQKVSSTPITADIDGDGKEEAIFLTGYYAGSYIDTVTPGTLIVMDGHTGATKWSKQIGTGQYEGLAVYPSSSNSKTLEIVVLAATSSNGDIEYILYDHTGQVKKRSTIPNTQGLEARVRVSDLNGDHKPDLLIQTGKHDDPFAGQLYMVDVANGTAPFILSYSSSMMPPVIADLDGDGLSEIIAGNATGELFVLQGAEKTDDGSTPTPDSKGIANTRQVLFTHVVAPVNVSPGQTSNGTQAFPMPKQPGQYFVEGVLKTDQNLQLAKSNATFSVGAKDWKLEGQLDVKLVRVGGKVTLQGSLINLNTTAIQGITLKIDDSDGNNLSTQTQLNLASQSKHLFTASWSPQTAGNHSFVITATANGLTTTTLELPFTTLQPGLKITVSAPSCVNAESFTVRATITNDGSVEGLVTLTLSGGATPQQQTVTIPAGDAIELVFHERVTSNATFTLTSTQDLQSTVTKQVGFCLKATITATPPTRATSGLIRIPYTLSVTGERAGEYIVSITPVSATVTESFSTSHMMPGVQKGEPAQVVKGEGALYLPVGTHTIKVETYGDSKTYQIEIVAPKASLSFVGAKQTFRSDEPINIPYEVTNLVALAANYEVYLSLSDDTRELDEKTFSHTLNASTKGTGTYTQPRLAPGNYTLSGVVTPGSGVVVKHTFKVINPISISMKVLTGARKDTAYVFDVEVTNAGLDPFKGSLYIHAGFFVTDLPVSVAAGKTQTYTISIPLVMAPVGKRTASVQLRDTTGATRAEQEVSFTRPAPQLKLIPPAAGQAFAAGTHATLTYTVKNQGIFDQIADIEIKVLEKTYQQKVSVKAGQSASFTLKVPIPDDLEENTYAALHRWSSAPDATLLPSRAGLTKFKVTGVKIDVKASLDKRSYKAGETALLSLEVRSIGTTQQATIQCRIRYGLHQEHKTLKLSATKQSLTVKMPLGQRRHHNMTIQCLSMKGRSLHIDSIFVHWAYDDMWLKMDKDVYSPGETVSYTIGASSDMNVSVLAIPLHQPVVHQKAYVLKKGVEQKGSFALPAVLPGGTQTVEVTFGKETRRFFFDVKGPFVYAKALSLDRETYQPEETIKSELILEARGTYDVDIVYTILKSSGVALQTGVVVSTKVTKGMNLVLADVKAPATAQGGLVLQAEVFVKGNKSMPMGRALARFELGDFAVRGVHPSKQEYALQLEDAELRVELHSVKKVKGSLRVSIEGAQIYDKEHEVDGFATIKIPVSKTSLPRIGVYLIEATFVVGERQGRAINTLRVADGTTPLIEITGVKEGEHYNQKVWPQIVVTGVHIVKDRSANLLNGLPFASGSPVEQEAEYTLHAKAQNAWGKTAETKRSFVLDMTPPEIHINGVSEGDKTTSFTPTIKVTDKYLKGEAYTLNGNPYNKGDSIDTPGKYTLLVRGWDKAGNTSEEIVSFELVQSTKLSLDILSPKKDAQFTEHQFTLKGKVSAPKAHVQIEGITVDVSTDGMFEGVVHIQRCQLEVQVTAEWEGIRVSKTLPIQLTTSTQAPLRHAQWEHPTRAAITGAAFTNDTLYVSVASTKQILSLDLKSGVFGKPEEYIKLTGTPGPLAIQDGTLWVIETDTQQLKAFKNKKEISSAFVTTAPTQLVLDTQGRPYVYGKDKIVYVRQDGTWKTYIDLQSYDVTALHWDRTEDLLYISDAKSKALWQVKDGALTSVMSLSFVPGPFTKGKDGSFVSKHKTGQLFTGKESKKWVTLPTGIQGVFTVGEHHWVVTDRTVWGFRTGPLHCDGEPLEKYREGQFPDGGEPDDPRARPGCGCTASSMGLPDAQWLLWMLVFFGVCYRKRRSRD
ncbi:MAG: hypothetical protein CL920_22860 [Deltaproteobacteria bacterium]|nr:hypothetical protein [Deltaproteobacteria bacterium]